MGKTRAANFVLCPAYHGATLFALLLNNHSRISSLGDAIPRKSYDQRCSCGRLVSECGFWQNIEKMVVNRAAEKQEYLLPMEPTLCSNQVLNNFLNKGLAALSLCSTLKVWTLIGKNGREYVRTYESFYETVCSIHKTGIFVEGSKNLIEPLLVRAFAKDASLLKVLHLTRDPRGYFWSQRKYHSQMTLQKAAIKWNRYHWAVERFRRFIPASNYLFLRYEDLCRQPDEIMRQVFNFLQVEPEEVCHAPLNRRKHHLMGNKMLFEFDGTIKYDTKWQKPLSEREQKTLLTLTKPLSSKFGYVE